MKFASSRQAVPFAAAALGALVIAGACNRDTTPEMERTTATPPAAAEPRTDYAVSTAVQAKYYGDDMTRGRQIDVTAENGVVTLRGTVPDAAAKQKAVELARGVEGVASVNDELQIRDATGTTAASAREQEARETAGTAGRDDGRAPAWITTKIQAQYFVDPDVSAWNIDVTTGSGGVVTLEGTVASEQNKAEAVRIARETEGVTRVEDKLKVDPDAQRDVSSGARDAAASVDHPDVWLTAKIQAKYFIDDDVKGRRIDVDTQNGVVTLKGTVASEAERRQAIALARNTNGVHDVKDNLQIDATARDRDRPVTDRVQKQAESIERPDAWITTKIQAQYFLDTDVKGHEINVDTKNGVVTLSGSVETAERKQEAEQIARETEGVKRVVNRLTVEAAAPR